MEFRILNKMPEYIQDIALEIELKKKVLKRTCQILKHYYWAHRNCSAQ